MTLTTYERTQLAGDQYEADFAAMFGKEIEALATWISRAPEGADIEAHFEQICETHDFDVSNDGIGTNWDYVRDCFESWSPRLRAARILREEREERQKAIIARSAHNRTAGAVLLRREVNGQLYTVDACNQFDTYQENARHLAKATSGAVKITHDYH